MESDLMSEIMNILEAPGAKDKILGMLSSDKTPPEETERTPPASFAPDFPDMFTKSSMEAMFQVKNIMERLNRKDDRRIGLLNSLKPFLPDGRERNIDTAIKFIQILNFAKGR